MDSSVRGYALRLQQPPQPPQRIWCTNDHKLSVNFNCYACGGAAGCAAAAEAPARRSTASTRASSPPIAGDTAARTSAAQCSCRHRPHSARPSSSLCCRGALLLAPIPPTCPQPNLKSAHLNRFQQNATGHCTGQVPLHPKGGRWQQCLRARARAMKYTPMWRTRVTRGVPQVPRSRCPVQRAERLRGRTCSSVSECGAKPPQKPQRATPSDPIRVSEMTAASPPCAAAYFWTCARNGLPSTPSSTSPPRQGIRTCLQRTAPQQRR